MGRELLSHTGGEMNEEYVEGDISEELYILMKSIKDLIARQNQLRIVDWFGDTGFIMVAQYEFDPLVEYGEDERRLWKTASFATE